MRSSTTLLERLARLSRAAFGIVAALGAAAIWGWVLGVPALRDLGADFAPMSPAAALALVLLATSFFAVERGRLKSARVAAALAAAIGVLTMIETLTGLPLGMSFYWLAPAGGEMPAHLSIAACITLLLIALVTPLAAVALGMVTLGERLTWRAVAGGALIMSGVALVVLRRARAVAKVEQADATAGVAAE
jgi:drug/metabolite transporter (DMT)-like permease